MPESIENSQKRKMSSNPFSALITTTTTTGSDGSDAASVAAAARLSQLIENVFLFTLDKDISRGSQQQQQFVYLSEIARDLPSSLFNFDLLNHAVFDRLLLPNPQDFLIPNNVRPADSSDTETVTQTKGLVYLFQCYERSLALCNASDSDSDSGKRIQGIILQNVATAVRTPDLYEGQTFPDQLLQVLKSPDSEFEEKQKFFSAAVNTIMSPEDAEEVESARECLWTTFAPLFDRIAESIKGATLITLEKWIFPSLNLFVHDKTNVHLANLLLAHITPSEAAQSSGRAYAQTILGGLLNLSILPKDEQSPCEYFENPHDTSSNLKATLWDFMKIHLDSMHTLVKGFLLVGGATRNGILTWFGDCLRANAKRGQMWSRDEPGRVVDSCSDAFMINLTGVLLRLSQPLLSPQLKVLLVDPTFVNVRSEERHAKQVHMSDMDKETCLLPRDDNEEEGEGENKTARPVADKYNFITEVFFLTHKALDLGLRVAVDRLIELNRTMAEAQNMYQELLAQPNGDQFLQLMTKQIQKFVSYLNTILGLANDGLLVEFYKATAIWLCQLVVVRVEEGDPARGFAPIQRRKIDLPITAEQENLRLLKSVPEFIFENIVGFFTFSRHFDSEAIEIKEDAQAEIFTMILVFMGSAERVKNPHLRARLAEGLETLLPKRDTQRPSYRNFTARLFENHPHRREIVPNLLRVFVGIEMTGQSVQFEQKFNYRRPMYAIMEYLWSMEEQKLRFRELAEEAEREMEAVDPPLFLRFINLLINDAIFLLDESLNNLQQIRTLQEAESSGAWASMSTQEQQQQRNSLRHLGMITRFDNILGKDTINILVFLTVEIKNIFSHSSMVDRVAAMLNYFLLNLVGPKQGNFKVSGGEKRVYDFVFDFVFIFQVRNREEYDFHPAHTVRQICQIYVNLMESDSFCLAVSQDGRSYSHQLFQFAEQILGEGFCLTASIAN